MKSESLDTIITNAPVSVDGIARAEWNEIRFYLQAAHLDDELELALLCETVWRLKRLDSVARPWQGVGHAIKQVFETGNALQPDRSPLSLFIDHARRYVPVFCDLRAPERADAFQRLRLGPLELSPFIVAAIRVCARRDAPVFLPVLTMAELFVGVSSEASNIFAAVDEILTEPGLLRDLERRRARWVAIQLARGWMNTTEVARYLRENLINSPRVNDPRSITDHDATHKSAVTISNGQMPDAIPDVA